MGACPTGESWEFIKRGARPRFLNHPLNKSEKFEKMAL